MDPVGLAFGNSSVSNSTHHWVELEHLIVADGRLYILYTHIPRTQMTSMFEGQPTKIRPFLIKARVIWVLGMQIFFKLDVYLLCIIMPMYLCIYILSIYCLFTTKQFGMRVLKTQHHLQKNIPCQVIQSALFIP